MDIRQLFATNLRRIRQKSGLSQEALAAEAGVDRAHVSKIEQERVYVGIEIVEKFSRVMKVEPHEFFRPLPRRKAARQE